MGGGGRLARRSCLRNADMAPVISSRQCVLALRQAAVCRHADTGMPSLLTISITYGVVLCRMAAAN